MNDLYTNTTTLIIDWKQWRNYVLGALTHPAGWGRGGGTSHSRPSEYTVVIGLQYTGAPIFDGPYDFVYPVNLVVTPLIESIKFEKLTYNAKLTNIYIYIYIYI